MEENKQTIAKIASGPRVKLASCKIALSRPVVYSTDRSKAMVPVLVLLFVALWFILRGALFNVLPCVILFLCFSVLLALRLPCFGKKELIFVLFVCLFDLCLFGIVCFLFLLVSGKGCGLWLWQSLDCSLTFFFLLSNGFCQVYQGSFIVVIYQSGKVNQKNCDSQTTTEGKVRAVLRSATWSRTFG